MFVRSFLAVLVAVASLDRRCQSQSAIVHWGPSCSHTDSMARPSRQVTANYLSTAIVDMYGRIYINGEAKYIRNIPPVSSGVSVVKLAVTADVAAMLLSNGDVIVWGQSPYFVPVAAPALPLGTAYSDIEAGGAHFVAIRSDGAIVAWGDNSVGQCIPPAVSFAPVQIACGAGHTLALLSDGTIAAWGYNASGQTQVPSAPVGTQYVHVSAGGVHSLAVRSDGEIVAWGGNNFGQCSVPARPPGTTYLLASAGQFHSVAYRSDGALVAWGANFQGQLNTPILSEQLLSLSSGYAHSVALTVSGKVIAWGSNEVHQAAIPNIQQYPLGTSYRGVATAPLHSVLLLSDGSIQSLGVNIYGQMSVPSTLVGSHFTKLGAGLTHTVALRDDGMIFAWGSNSAGQCSVPALPASITFRDVAVSDGHSVALRSDGAAVAWGPAAHGCDIVPALPLGVAYSDVDVRYGKTLLVRTDGNLSYAGTTAWNDHLIPSLPPGVQYVKAACCHVNSAALRSDGTVTHWGSLSTGSVGWRSVPTLPFGVYYVDLDGGYGHLLLLRSDGEIEVCGMVGYNFPPPPLEPGTSFVEIMAGNEGSAARIGPYAKYIGIAQGCAGSRPISRLVPHDLPHIGQVLKVTVFDVPDNISVLAFGWQSVTPVSLASVGAPGCALHVSLDGTAVLLGQGNRVQWTLPIPHLPILVGARFYNQVLVFDANSGNGLGAVVSDAAEATIGGG